MIKIFHNLFQLKNTHRFQNQEPQQLNVVPDQHQHTTTLRNLPDSSDTLTVQNVSELSDTTTITPQSFTVTSDSNVIQSPVRNITQNTKTDQNQNNTSTLSTLNTTVTQPFQTQSPLRNFDPPPLPTQNSFQTTPHNSPQQSSSNTNGTNALQVQPETQFQTTTQLRQTILQTLSYTPTQTTQTHNKQHGLTINTLQSNTSSNHITSKNLSKPPLQTIPNNPLSYSLKGTNTNNTHTTLFDSQ